MHTSVSAWIEKKEILKVKISSQFMTSHLLKGVFKPNLIV